jgi:gliding motility-associated-like protein
MRVRTFLLPALAIFLTLSVAEVMGQACLMEPGFQFLTSSRGCAPFTVQLETLYLQATPGTIYYIDWGDGTPEQTYVQTNATGVIIQHTYPNSPVDCGYDLSIDASNGCNPRGSVIPLNTQVVVWTNDVISIDPGVFRVCQGYATSLQFVDNSDWNCFPRATRENNEPRWIQWIYGTGTPANQIPGMGVNGSTPGAFPYLNPAPLTNPIFPVYSPGQVSLPVNVPVTTPADIGKEFQITLRNWNQCNPYDENTADGGHNPVSGDLVNGDNNPQVTTARIVIVDSPDPQFDTRLGNASGPVQSIFCIGDDIYFDNNTPPIGGANLQYRWEFFGNSAGTGSPLSTSTQTNPTYSYTVSGQKLVRLRVRDANAAGNCEAVFDRVITISPSVTAQIQITDLSNNPITPDFCQEANSPYTNFNARFIDASFGTPIASTEYRWEFYDQNNNLVFEAPGSGGFSSTPMGPFDRVFSTKGIYRVRLRIRDNVTGCESADEKFVRVFEKPVPVFSFNRVCEGNDVTFTESSTLNPLVGESITLWEWDMDYDGVSFSKDPSLDNQQSFDYAFSAAGTHQVALRVTASQGSCSAMLVQDVIVDPAPNASITPDVTSGCSVLTVNFTNNDVSNQPVAVDRFIWEVDNGGGMGFQVDSVQRPTDPGFSGLFTRAFVNTGITNVIYTVRLRVVNVNNCETLSTPVAITVYPGPKSGFVSLNYSPFNDNCSPQVVNFSVDNQTQSLNPTDYLWIVSDNNGIVSQTSTGTTPSYSYSFANATQSMKDYRITLRTTLPSSCYGDSTRVIRIAPLPSSDFTMDTLLYDCDKMKMMFEATQKGLTEYAWTILVNNTIIYGTTTSNDFLEYEFNRISGLNQNVQVRLTTRNFANCESPETTKGFIVPQYNNINASFVASPVSQTLPNSTISIVNTSNPGPWSYQWDFGDGTTSVNPNVNQHTYSTFGMYTITLSVSNGDCSATQTAMIEIKPIPPVLDFDYNPDKGCAPLTVTFTDKSQYADPGSYVWQFGDNQGTSRAINPTYTYYEPGIYSVTLTAANALGETSTITKHAIIEVYDKPSAQFNLKPRVIYTPGGKLYTDNQSFGASSYLWHFGDGNTSTDFEPEHTYMATDEGHFDVTLIAYNDWGCTDTLTVDAAVQVLKGGQLLIPNAFSPNLSGPGNANGENDVFLPLMRGVQEFQMLVFNRWGELLYETTNPAEGWDGYYQGRLCPQDVYVYKIIAKFSDGQMVTRVGDINLLR